ncbi:shikimate kinase [Spirulina subsalsa]|uniref:shikimate kinase n=1 Tax=Spirulina TaxID=1154 RepID=UPI003A937357
MHKMTQNLMLKRLSLFLVGMMGSGKSTVGRLLSRQINYRFFDTDVLIEQVTNQTISDLFATAGEGYFRRLETQVLEQVCAYNQSVIATGGGAVLASKNWGYLREGLVIWLDPPLEVIAARLEQSQDTSRPLLGGQDRLSQLTTLHAARCDRYAQADLHIQPQPEDSPEAIASAILAAIPTVIKPPPTPVQE